MDRKIVAAAAQVAPRYMDKDQTIDRVCGFIAEAGRHGADLIVFPETMIPGYPYWRAVQPNARWAELMVQYQRNSVRVGTEDTERLSAAARAANICVVVGCSELSDRAGSGTLYNSMLFFERDGRLIGRHRKLMPTHAERLIWGCGDPADLQVFDMSIGRVGGLVCFEHHVTLFKAALCALGEEIHCGVWPGWWHQEHHPSIKRRWVQGDDIGTCDILPAVREYAFETQTFFVSASQYVSEEDLPDYAKGFNIGAGGSMIVNATGLYLAPPLMDSEQILYAELDPEERMAMKAYFDALGHYARFDAVQLAFEPRHYDPIEPSHGELRRAADHAGADVSKVEAVAERRASVNSVPANES